MRWFQSVTLLLLLAPALLGAQEPAGDRLQVTRISDSAVQIGNIRVDMKKREASVSGKINETTMLEFVANSKGGFKAYESAIELDTSATVFNTAMLLIGLDPKNARPATRHFDPATPAGDPVEVWVEWTADNKTQRVRAEDLIWNQFKKITFPRGEWVYTGSGLLKDGTYLAERDGTLIGFIHDPAVIIENPQSAGVGGFGSWQFNPNVGLKPGDAVAVIVRAVDKSAAK